MGLDTSHGCWNGPYSSFNRWREKICELSGYGNLLEYEGFTLKNPKPWPSTGDPLIELLRHSDCDGEIKWQVCLELSNRLGSLFPALEISDAVCGSRFAEKTETFAEGLRFAAKRKEDVIFQ
jgi:hypothetical protein